MLIPWELDLHPSPPKEAEEVLFGCPDTQEMTWAESLCRITVPQVIGAFLVAGAFWGICTLVLGVFGGTQ